MLLRPTAPTAAQFTELVRQQAWTCMHKAETYGEVVPYEAYESFLRARSTFPIRDHVFPLMAFRSSAKSTTSHLLPQQQRSSSVIRTCTYFDSPQFSLNVFCLPPHSQLDLHDHPTMSVWQAVLCGELHSLRMDYAERQWNTSAVAPATAEVIVCGNSVQTNQSEAALFHAETGGGVLHLIRNPSSTEWLVFVDLISLPYGSTVKQQTLDCSYFDVVSSVCTAAAAAPLEVVVGPPRSREERLRRDTMLLKEASVGTRLLLQRRQDVLSDGPQMSALLRVS